MIVSFDLAFFSSQVRVLESTKDLFLNLS